jgi:hypothetical protein
LQIPEGHLNTTAFLCQERVTEAGVEIIPVATAFFVIDRAMPAPFPVWAVTGRHCIQEARAAGRPMYLRVNTPDSHVDIAMAPDDWHESNEADVAVAYSRGPITETAVPLDQFVDDDYRYRGSVEIPAMAAAGGPIVSVGHEVFVVGLFSQHAGKNRNLPIARFGNVARPPLEPISVTRRDKTREIISEAYLIESRSFGGHSGSPVFWGYPFAPVHMADPALGLRPNRAARRAGEPNTGKIPVSVPQHIIALMGIVSAHFDIPREAKAEGDVLGKVITEINAGIAVVTPAHYIKRLIDSEEVRAEAAQYREQRELEPSVTMDLLDFDQFTEPEASEGEKVSPAISVSSLQAIERLFFRAQRGSSHPEEE